MRDDPDVHVIPSKEKYRASDECKKYYVQIFARKIYQ